MDYLQILGILYLVYRVSRRTARFIFSPTAFAQRDIKNAQRVNEILSFGYNGFEASTTKVILLTLSVVFLALDLLVVWFLV